jgi:threonine/homoserine/homoserine lactone efflux protein
MGAALRLGVIVGFPIAASPGPMFFLVLRRSVAGGWRRGLLSGAGIASGDAVYAAIAAFGLTALINVLVAQRRWIQLIGGIAIIAIGLRTLVTKYPLPNPPHKGEGESSAAPHKREGESSGAADKRRHVTAGDYLSTFLLTLSNPPTILSFLAVFAAIGVRVGSGWAPAVGFVIGVLIGSALWWLTLTSLVVAFRQRMSPRITTTIGALSGVALIIFGLFITLQSL